MSVDQRLLLAQDLDLLANQRTLFVEQCFSLEERALWVQEVLRLCEVTQHHLPPNADGIVSKIRWVLDVYATREERALTKAQRLTWAEQAVRTMRAAAGVLKTIAEQPARQIDLYLEYNEAFHAGKRFTTPKGKGRVRQTLPPIIRPPAKGDPRDG